ncbi:hypothetical protein [Luteolibacter luteus]|uniref:FG-GAP repeat protein n=1 Tax=Luteolibacter luteus TaxID=2728835 RepID=A0A858RDU1_9BACT|nr:hypothetical protein [Luteolibacter luteus]QJE94490.1 hypothetical protein HHL09_01365 [Luteolibacter luteus]
MNTRVLLSAALLCGLASLFLPDSNSPQTATPPSQAEPVLKATPLSSSSESIAPQGNGVIADPSLEKVLTATRLGIRAITSAESLHPDNEGALYFATNPGQQLAARFRADGVSIRNSSGGEALAISRRDCETAHIATHGTRIEYQRADGSTEWYQNSDTGFEHGMTITARPQGGSDELRILFDSGNLSARADEVDPGDLVFSDKTGKPLYGYRDLKAWDATGRALQGELAVAESGFEWVIQDRGAVYPVTIDPLVVSLDESIPGSEADSDGYFGGIQIDIDGDRAMVAASQETTASGTNAGLVYLFLRSGPDWVLEKTIESLDPRAHESFGHRAALAGDTLAVLARNDIDPEVGGSVQMFRYTGITWMFDTKLRSGDSVSWANSLALEDSTLVLGLPGKLNIEGVGTGAFMVSTRSFGQWSSFNMVYPPDGVAGDSFGWSIDIDGNRIVVGSPGRSQGAKQYCGSVFVYQGSLNFWNKEAELFAEDAAGSDQLGQVVAIDGDRVIAGAPELKRTSLVNGAAYIFSRTGGVWSQETKIIGPPPVGFHVYMGSSVAMANGGSRVAIGNMIGKVNGGQVAIYERVGRTWFRRASLITDFSGDTRYPQLGMTDTQLIVGLPIYGPLGSVEIYNLGNSSSGPEISVFTGPEKELREIQSGAPLSFGEVYPNEQGAWPLTIYNDGASQLQILDASLQNDASQGLSVDPVGNFPSTNLFIEPGQTAQVMLRTNFPTLGLKSGTLRLTSTDPDEVAFDVPVSFQVVTKPLPPGLTIRRVAGISILRYPHLQFMDYQVERSADLSTWQPIGSMQLEWDAETFTNIRIFRDFNAPSDKVFYRVNVQ